MASQLEQQLTILFDRRDVNIGDSTSRILGRTPGTESGCQPSEPTLLSQGSDELCNPRNKLLRIAVRVIVCVLAISAHDEALGYLDQCALLLANLVYV